MFASNEKPIYDRKKSVLDKYEIVEKDINVVKLINLDSGRIRLLGDVGMCINLTICLVGNNYLYSIDGLAGCRQLIRLDLHGNRVITFSFCLLSLRCFISTLYCSS